MSKGKNRKSSQEKNNPPKSNPRGKKQQPNAVIRYSGMAFQMAATIGLGVWGGIKLDEWVQWNAPVFTIVLSLLAVAVAIYFVIKDLSKL